MNFECKKTENCFSDSQTYEYRLPITAESFLHTLDGTWQTRCNLKLRRPVFLAERNGVHIKGILAGTVIRVSFPNDSWEAHKKLFEEGITTINERLF